MELKHEQAADHVEEADGEQGGGYRKCQRRASVIDQFGRVVELSLRQRLSLTQFGEHRFMRADLFAQWGRGAILQPTDVHEYASGEEYFNDGGKDREITPETEKHSADVTRIRGCRRCLNQAHRPEHICAFGVVHRGYRDGVADNEVMDFDGDAERGSRTPRGVYDVGREPDPLYTLANERTYLSWLRLAVTLLAGAVAIDRLFLENPWFGSQILALGLVAIAFGTCGLSVRRWWVTERALRRRQPLPGFGAPLLGVMAIVLAGAGVIVLILTRGR